MIFRIVVRRSHALLALALDGAPFDLSIVSGLPREKSAPGGEVSAGSNVLGVHHRRTPSVRRATTASVARSFTIMLSEPRFFGLAGSRHTSFGLCRKTPVCDAAPHGKARFGTLHAARTYTLRNKFAEHAQPNPSLGPAELRG